MIQKINLLLNVLVSCIVWSLKASTNEFTGKLITILGYFESLTTL